MPQAMTSWDALYRALRAAFGDNHYHVGVKLAGVEAAGDTVTARFDGGPDVACDLLVAADGPARRCGGNCCRTCKRSTQGTWRGGA